MDDLFSVENLKKMAGPSKSPLQSPGHTNPYQQPFNLTELKKDSQPLIQTANTKVNIPIDVNLGELNYTLNAEARITLRLNIDLAAVVDAQKIKDKKDRIKRIRQLIRLDATRCEVNFA